MLNKVYKKWKITIFLPVDELQRTDGGIFSVPASLASVLNSERAHNLQDLFGVQGTTEGRQNFHLRFPAQRREGERRDLL